MASPNVPLNSFAQPQVGRKYQGLEECGLREQFELDFEALEQEIY
jgi:hypothetical protein